MIVENTKLPGVLLVKKDVFETHPRQNQVIHA